jgi:hypothetical protein
MKVLSSNRCVLCFDFSGFQASCHNIKNLLTICTVTMTFKVICQHCGRVFVCDSDLCSNFVFNYMKGQ